MQAQKTKEINWDNIGSLVIPPIRSPEKFTKFSVLSHVNIEEVPIDPYGREYCYKAKTVWAGRIFCMDRKTTVFRYDLEIINPHKKLSDYEAAVRIAETDCELGITKNELIALQYERGDISLSNIKKMMHKSPSKEALRTILKLQMRETSLNNEQLDQIVKDCQYKGPSIKEYLQESVYSAIKSSTELHKTRSDVCFVLKENVNLNELSNYVSNSEKYAGFIKGTKYYPNGHIFKKFNRAKNVFDIRACTVDELITFYKDIRLLKKHINYIRKREKVHITERKLKKYIINKPLPRNTLKLEILCDISNPLEKSYTEHQISEIADYITNKVLNDDVLPARHDE